MLVRSSTLVVVAAALGFAIVAPEARAGTQRTFVRSDGNDANACSVTQPCRTFGAALAKTNDAGEIIVLDSAGYGAVTIGQSVSIVSPAGVYAGIAVFSGDGIAINGNPAAQVVLRGLAINGQGGSIGVRLQQGARLHVENCEISNMASHGVSIEAGAEVFVNDTTVRDNAGTGVYVGTTASVVIDRLRSERNGNGLYAAQGNVVVRDSVVSRSGYYGIAFENFGAVSGPSKLVVEGSLVAGSGADGVRLAWFGSGTLDGVVARNTIVDNDWGVAAGGTVKAALVDNVIRGSAQAGIYSIGASTYVTASGNTVTNGSIGVKTVGGTIRTRTNNTVIDNVVDLDPSTTLSPLSPL